MTGELESGFGILRATIESALEVPIAITVTSALPGDGKTEIALGLSRAFSFAGYRTIVIDANPRSPGLGTAFGVGRLRAPASLEDSSSMPVTKISAFLEVASIADETLAEASSSVALRAFIESLRGRYAVTIWDAGDVYTSSLALQCAAASDGTVLAVRYGRKPTPEDGRLVATLEQVGGRVIGIVPTACPANRNGRGDVRERAFLPEDVAPAAARRAGKSTA